MYIPRRARLKTEGKSAENNDLRVPLLWRDTKFLNEKRAAHAISEACTEKENCSWAWRKLGEFFKKIGGETSAATSLSGVFAPEDLVDVIIWRLLVDYEPELLVESERPVVGFEAREHEAGDVELDREPANRPDERGPQSEAPRTPVDLGIVYEVGRNLQNFANFCKFLAGSFSAVSKRNFARK